MKSTHPGSRCVQPLKEDKLLLLAITLLFLVGCGGSKLHFAPSQPKSVVDRLSVPIPTQIIVDSLGSLPPQPALLFNQHTLAIQPLEDATIEQYGLLELDLNTDLRVANPYDPNEIDLRVQFTAPSGRVVDIGAFWYQGFNIQTRRAEGEPGWKARFTADETGTWQAVAYTRDFTLQSEIITFNVIASSRPGFVRINPSNPHYLALDDGDFFFPIGVNMAWSRGWSDPLENYTRWLDQFSANGGNTIRVWMAAWSFGIEWKDTGLGNYDQRQNKAWQLDQLFHLAEERGVKIILVLINHGAFSLGANSEWKNNPYNAALGGPLSSPKQFVTDPVARSYFQRRLNYIINRWSYSTALLAWEWFNEVDLTPIPDELLIPWLQEMTTYLDQRDVNHHLTTNSFSVRHWSPTWQLPEIDIVQRHEYTNAYEANNRDLAGRSAQDFQLLAQSTPDKPILLGEFGYSAIDYGDNIESTGIHLHNGLWATTFSGYAGSGMYWWWDIYIDPNGLWKHFKSLSEFLTGEDLSQDQPFTPLILSRTGYPASGVVGLGLRGENTMVWLRSNGYTTQASIAGQNGTGDSSAYLPPTVEGHYLTLDGVADGQYAVSWYNPQSSGWMSRIAATANNGTLTIPIPPFRADLAVKITRIP